MSSFLAKTHYERCLYTEQIVNIRNKHRSCRSCNLKVRLNLVIVESAVLGSDLHALKYQQGNQNDQAENAQLRPMLRFLMIEIKLVPSVWKQWSDIQYERGTILRAIWGFNT